MADEVKDTLRAWIAADDEIRGLQAQIKTIRERKNTLGAQVLSYMKDFLFPPDKARTPAQTTSGCGSRFIGSALTRWRHER